MKSNYLKFLLGVLLGVLGALGALAAEPGKIRFRTVASEGEITGVFYQHQGKAVEIKADNSMRSPYYAAEVVEELVFFRPGENPDHVDAREEVGRVSIGQLGSTVLVLVVKNPEGGLMFYGLADGLEFAPPGSFVFFNAAKDALEVVAGVQRGGLAPGAAVVFEAQVGEASPSALLQVFLAGEPARLVYSNRVATYPDQRTLVLALNSGNSRSPVLIKRIMENVRLAVPAEPNGDKSQH